jgi:RNA polymerase sigma factor (TIGR02999 family)
MTESAEVTALLDELRQGKQDALARLMPVVYAELHRLASHYMRRERRDHTLQTTALIHEAYLRLAGRSEKKWHNRTHFFAVAAEIMRGILVDHARGCRRAKRGGAAQTLRLDESRTLAVPDSEELLALDQTLRRLAEIDPRQSRIVELRYFAGLSVADVALLLGLSERTVLRDWNMAKAWLYGELRITAAVTHR